VAAEVERSVAATSFRFSAGQAYWDLVQARVREFREKRIGDLRTLGGFLSRRLAPAMNSCAAAARRQEELSARIERASALLRTRVDVAREEQNQQLLAAMERRGKIGLRLQQTVEGLSVAALTYYLVGLVGYGVKPLKAVWPQLNTDWVIAGSIPVLAFIVWRAVGRLRRRAEGSGNVIDDDRGLAGFSRLVVQGPLDVRVQFADADRVVVHADDNIAPLIETAVQDGTLTIRLRPGASFRTRSKVQVRLQARRFNGVVLHGSGDVRADRVEAEVFEATLQGSGDITVKSLHAGAVAVSIAGNGDVRLAGTAASLGAVIDGSGDLRCADLVAQQVAVRIRGSGDARVHAVEELKVDIDGSGDVRYRGTPKITQSIRGTGSVAPLR
jgi:hypothetical protein